MKYVLEPMLFAFEPDMSEQELTDYLDELLALDDWWNRHREDMFVQDSTNDALWENSYYPIADTLKPLLMKYGINYIQYGDVIKIIEKMLTKSNMIESLFDEMCGITNQTLKKELAVKPQVKRSEALNDELLKLLGNVFLAHANGGYDDKSFVVIEVVGNKINQAYGACNNRPDKETLEFLSQYARIRGFLFDPESACRLAEGTEGVP